MAGRPAMTPRCVRRRTLILCVLLHTHLAVAHEHSEALGRSSRGPPTTRLIPSGSPYYAAPPITHRKCGHQPLPLAERRSRAKALEPLLQQFRQRPPDASFQTGRRHLRGSPVSGAPGIVSINVYWHIVELSGTSLQAATCLTPDGAPDMPYKAVEADSGCV